MGVHVHTRVYMHVHARNDSFQARDGDGDQLLGLLLAHWLPGVLPSPEHRGSCSGAVGLTCSFTFTPSTVSTLFCKRREAAVRPPAWQLLPRACTGSTAVFMLIFSLPFFKLA